MPSTPLPPQGLKHLVIQVTQDPRASHRPAEALRLAAGLAAWQEMRVTLYCVGGGVWLLRSPWHTMREGEALRQALIGFLEAGGMVAGTHEAEWGADQLEAGLGSRKGAEPFTMDDCLRADAWMRF